MASDLELATRVAGSDDQVAFCSLVERHQATIRRFLRRLLCGDHSTADDLAQQCFLQAYLKIHTWRAKGSFVSWLHTIAYRQFLQHSGKQAQQPVMAWSLQSHFEQENGPVGEAGTAVDAEMMSFPPPCVGACGTINFLKQLGHSMVCPDSPGLA